MDTSRNGRAVVSRQAFVLKVSRSESAAGFIVLPAIVSSRAGIREISPSCDVYVQPLYGSHESEVITNK